ncbi:hypothetical protein ACTUSN_02080 [Pantoea ananatis]|uniref:hypothetical protein n=1 Tax=Pantoea ananas TaxID=553 RepID=UPI001B305511|nr:hypothetical protein [Pantoea ananatis]
MNISFEEVLENDYFLKVMSTDNRDEVQKQLIVIGIENKESKNEFSDINYQEGLIDFGELININIHQQSHDTFANNKKNLTRFIKLIYKRNENAVVKISIISDDFIYYYRQYYSILYTDNTFVEKNKNSINKIVLIILLKRYLGYKAAYFARAFYLKFRKLVRF